ncbi:hypothetical protein ACU4GD_34500 [Cupriavidus basilensis]
MKAVKTIAWLASTCCWNWPGLDWRKVLPGAAANGPGRGRTQDRQPAYNAGSDTQSAARGAEISHDDPARYLHFTHSGWPD